MFQTKVVEKIKTHILCSILIFRKLYRNVEECGRARQVTDDNIIRHMRIACSITRATRARTHTPTHVFNPYSFSTATMVTRTRVGITCSLRVLFSHGGAPEGCIYSGM